MKRYLWAVSLLILMGCSKEALRQDDAVLLAEGEGKQSLQNPAFSPSGERIIYTVFQEGYNRGPSRIWIMSTSGSDQDQLTPEVAEDDDFMDVNLPGSCWSVARDRITFASDRQDADEIWTMKSDGTDLVRVTHHTNPPYYFEPSFSPDGSKIVFEIDYEDSRWEDGLRGEIWMVSSEGAGLARLVGTDSNVSEFDDRQPNWSPRGDRILFQRRDLEDQEDWDIYTVTPEGDSLFNVTDSRYSDTDASFSPDGSEISYSSDCGDLENPNIFIIPSQGGTPRRVTFAEGYEDGAPSFSPDGSKIAFESHEIREKDKPAGILLIELGY